MRKILLALSLLLLLNLSGCDKDSAVNQDIPTSNDTTKIENIEKQTNSDNANNTDSSITDNDEEIKRGVEDILKQIEELKE